MKTFYKILFEKSKFKDGTFHGNINDIYEGFEEAGFHRYDFAVEHIFSKKPLTTEEYNAIKAENDDTMKNIVDELAKSINKEILNRMYG